MGREQRDIPCLVWEWLAGTGSGACWADASKSKSRERFPVLFGLIEQHQELESNVLKVTLDNCNTVIHLLHLHTLQFVFLLKENKHPNV